MKRSIVVYVLAGLAAVAVFSACRGRGGAVPRSGDTVTPQLDEAVDWTAGQPGQLSVRLAARGKDDSAPRLLGFAAVSAGVNPVAVVTFYKGSQAESPVTVTLDHRC
jgi:hypothetical protein